MVRGPLAHGVRARGAPRPWALDLVGAALASYPGAKFFLAHGGVVAAVLFLVWTASGRGRLVVARAPAGERVRRRHLRGERLVGTNYMYLREKPRSGTLLDVLGPWPWYVLAADGFALALLALLYAPFRRGQRVAPGTLCE